MPHIGIKEIGLLVIMAETSICHGACSGQG